jgi:predicted cobalt transporter CbtA
MNAGYFIAIVLVSGFVAGTIHGAVNLAIVEPYLDEAIGIENQALFESGEAEDTPQFWVEYNSYRDWQKSGQLLAGGILGMSIGALFGIVFAYSRNSLPKGHTVKKTFVLAAIMWLTIFLIPFLKYPANPPTVGEADTVILRQTLYLLFIAISGFSAVGFSRLYKKLENKKYLAFVGYAVFITAVFFIMPPSPDEVTAPMDLVNGFRTMSVVAVSIFWIAEAFILGALWQRYKTKLDESSFKT